MQMKVVASSESPSIHICNVHHTAHYTANNTQQSHHLKIIKHNMHLR